MKALFDAMSRRSLLLYTLKAIASWLATSFGFVRSAEATSATRGLRVQRILNGWSRPDATHPIGSSYLAQFSTESSIDSLLSSLEWFEFEGRPKAWIASFPARCRSDFRAGRIVEIDGWLLSRTEARVRALEFLLADSH